jgi:hypothetical protein
MNSDAANSWLPLIQKHLKNATKKDIGKILSGASEHYVKNMFMNKYNVNILLKEGLPYDGIFMEGGGVFHKEVRIQIKYRSDDWHLEVTRRHCAKNKGSASKSGHCVYSTEEFDMLAVVVPGNDGFHVDNHEFYLIPAHELEDPKNPGFIVKRVPMHIRRKYSNIATRDAVVAKYFGFNTEGPILY